LSKKLFFTTSRLKKIEDGMGLFRLIFGQNRAILERKGKEKIWKFLNQTHVAELGLGAPLIAPICSLICTLIPIPLFWCKKLGNNGAFQEASDAIKGADYWRYFVL
jgi:hypothetical protein